MQDILSCDISQGGGSEVIDVNERQHFLDILRVAATCAVVLFHTVMGVMDNTDMSLYPMEQKVFLTVRDLVCWCVPIFIMISGYLFLNPNRELTICHVLKKYCRRVVLALLLFGVPYAWIELMAVEGCFRMEMLWQGVIRVLHGESWSHMWYLYLILLLYLLTPAIRWVLKRIPMAAVAVLLAVLFVGSSILPFAGILQGIPQSALWTLSGELIYLFYYLWGYLFACRIKWEKRQLSISVCLAFVLALGMSVSRILGFSMQMAYNYPFTVLLSLCLFYAGLAWEKCRVVDSCPIRDNKNTELWKRAAQLCFAVYLIHPVFLNVFYKYFHLTPLSFYIGVSLPTFFLGTLALSVIAAWMLRKIPLLRKYIL